MSPTATSGADRLLLAVALLSAAAGAVPDVGSNGDGGGWGSLVLSLILLWRIRQGSHAAWVAFCSFATMGALLCGMVLLADATSSGTVASASAAPIAVISAATVLLLTSVPVRRLVGRAREAGPVPDREPVR